MLISEIVCAVWMDRGNVTSQKRDSFTFQLLVFRAKQSHVASEVVALEKEVKHTMCTPAMRDRKAGFVALRTGKELETTI